MVAQAQLVSLIERVGHYKLILQGFSKLTGRPQTDRWTDTKETKRTMADCHVVASSVLFSLASLSWQLSTPSPVCSMCSSFCQCRPVQTNVFSRISLRPSIKYHCLSLSIQWSLQIFITLVGVSLRAVFAHFSILSSYSLVSPQSVPVSVNYHIISYQIISYHIISYHIISYHIISYHSFIHSGHFYSAPSSLQVLQATTQRRSRIQHGYCIGVSRRSAQANAGKLLAKGPYVAARAGVELTTLRLKFIVSTKAPPRPT